MRSIILLAVSAIAIPFIISFVAPANRVGTAVSARFLERPGGIPSEPQEAAKPVNADTLRTWVTSAETAAYAQAYAWRIIPIDFLYIIAFGGFMAIGAQTLASGISPENLLGRVPICFWAAFPAIYALTDFLEDILILALLTEPSKISDLTVSALASLRWAKICSSALALLQLFVLGLGGSVPFKGASPA